MARIFTTADRDSIKDAMVTLAIEGVASATIGDRSVTTRSLDELRKLLDLVQQDFATAQPRGGMRFLKTIPPAAG